jgi:hypothetical protein
LQFDFGAPLPGESRSAPASGARTASYFVRARGTARFAYNCACGVIHDRDPNAAINLVKFAARSCGDARELRAVTACGEEGADGSPVTAVKPASVKQDPRRDMFAHA